MVLFVLFKGFSCKTSRSSGQRWHSHHEIWGRVFSFSRFRDISRERSERRLGVLVLLGEVCSTSSCTEGRKGEGALCFPETSERKVAFGEQVTM